MAHADRPCYCLRWRVSATARGRLMRGHSRPRRAISEGRDAALPETPDPLGDRPLAHTDALGRGRVRPPLEAHLPHELQPIGGRGLGVMVKLRNVGI